MGLREIYTFVVFVVNMILGGWSAVELRQEITNPEYRHFPQNPYIVLENSWSFPKAQLGSGLRVLAHIIVALFPNNLTALILGGLVLITVAVDLWTRDYVPGRKDRRMWLLSTSAVDIPIIIRILSSLFS